MEKKEYATSFQLSCFADLPNTIEAESYDDAKMQAEQIINSYMEYNDIRNLENIKYECDDIHIEEVE